MSLILGIAVVTSYTIASARDPGKLRPNFKSVTFLDLLLKFNPTELCPDCKIIRTSRSRHCAICNVCVERFDHHCPWINNCVGVRNHGAFLIFLMSTAMLCVTSMMLSVASMVYGVSENVENNPLGKACIFNKCTIPGVFYTFGSIVFIITFLFTFPIR